MTWLPDLFVAALCSSVYKAFGDKKTKKVQQYELLYELLRIIEN